MGGGRIIGSEMMVGEQLAEAPARTGTLRTSVHPVSIGISCLGPERLSNISGIWPQKKPDKNVLLASEVLPPPRGTLDRRAITPGQRGTVLTPPPPLRQHPFCGMVQPSVVVKCCMRPGCLRYFLLYYDFYFGDLGDWVVVGLKDHTGVPTSGERKNTLTHWFLSISDLEKQNGIKGRPRPTIRN